MSDLMQTKDWTIFTYCNKKNTHEYYRLLPYGIYGSNKIAEDCINEGCSFIHSVIRSVDNKLFSIEMPTAQGVIKSFNVNNSDMICTLISFGAGVGERKINILELTLISIK